MDEGINGSLICSRKPAAKVVRNTTFALIGWCAVAAVTNQRAASKSDKHDRSRSISQQVFGAVPDCFNIDHIKDSVNSDSAIFGPHEYTRVSLCL